MRFTGDRLFDIAKRNRLPDAVSVAARRDPPDHALVVPDRLVPDRIGILRIDGQRDELAFAATRLLGERRIATDEIGLVEMYEPAEACLVRAVDGPELTRPRAEALLQA